MKSLIAVHVALMFLFAACGKNNSDVTSPETSPEEADAASTGNGPSISSAWLTDPCSLIGDEEMSELLPHSVAGSVVSNGLCSYGSTDLTLGRVNIELFVQDVAATGCDLFFSVGGFGSAEPVDGVGTAARWKGGSGTKQLGVCVDDDKTMAITVYDPDKDTDPLAVTRAVAEMASARISNK